MGTYPGFGKRFWAWTLDWIVVLIPELALLPVVSWCISAFPLGQSAIIVLLSWLIQPAYKIYFHYFYGQTVGKRLAGIRVRSWSGGSLSLKQAVVRSLPSLAYTIIYFIGWVQAASWIRGDLFREASFLERGRLLSEVQPGWVELRDPVAALWLLLSFVVLLRSTANRTVHDYFAGTVVVLSEELETSSIYEEVV